MVLRRLFRPVRAWWRSLPPAVRVLIMLVLLVLVVLVIALGVQWALVSHVAILWDGTGSMNDATATDSSKCWFDRRDNIGHAHWLKESCLPDRAIWMGDKITTYRLVSDGRVYVREPFAIRGMCRVGPEHVGSDPGSDYVRAVNEIARALNASSRRDRKLVVIGDLLNQSGAINLYRPPTADPPDPPPEDLLLFKGVMVVLVYPQGRYPFGTLQDRDLYPAKWLHWWRTYFRDRGCTNLRTSDFQTAPDQLEHWGIWRGVVAGQPRPAR